MKTPRQLLQAASVAVEVSPRHLIPGEISADSRRRLRLCGAVRLPGLATGLALAMCLLAPVSLLAANHPPEIAGRDGGRALQFDGVNDYVVNTSPAFGVRSNLTVTAWIRNTDDFLTAEYNGQPAGNYLLSKGVSAISGGP
jgi:hypothetical protein